MWDRVFKVVARMSIFISRILIRADDSLVVCLCPTLCFNGKKTVFNVVSNGFNYAALFVMKSETRASDFVTKIAT